MLLVILTAIYCFIGGLLVGGLLDDNGICHDKLDKVLCVLVGVFWPAAIALAIVVLLHDKIQDKKRLKRHARKGHIKRFCTQLSKLQLISKDAFIKIQRKLNE